MKDYGDGYVTDLPYDTSYFKELNPNNLRTLLLLKGITLPKRQEGEPFRYLELGYGQGISLNIHAASNEGEFWGTDFNPQHTIDALKPLAGCDNPPQILNASFGELAEKGKEGQLPQFDVIVLHGIWSWINKENQQFILDVINTNLKVGGVVYVSYNCQPGWSGFIPVRDLLMYHTSEQSHPNENLIVKTQKALSFLKTLDSCGANYFKNNPPIQKRLKGLESQSIKYLIHEYLNQNWDIPYFKDVATAFERAKCEFAASTRPLGYLTVILPEEVQKMMKESNDIKFIETVRDFTLNTQFRCDLYTKGANRLQGEELLAAIEDLKFILAIPQEKVKYTITSPRGDLNCKEELYKPFIEFLMAEDYRPKSIAEVRQLPAYKDLKNNALLEIITIFLGAHFISPVQEVSAEVQKRCDHINTFLCEKSMKNSYSQALASPVLGAGVGLSHIDQMFLHSKQNVNSDPKKYVKHVYDILKKQKQTIKHKGKDLDDDGTMKLLTENAAKFEENLPLLKRLGIKINPTK